MRPSAARFWWVHSSRTYGVGAVFQPTVHLYAIAATIGWESELGEIYHDLSARSNRLAFLGGGIEPVLPDSGLGLLVQSKPEAAFHADLFRQSVFAHQNRDHCLLHPWMSYKWIGEISVNRVDGDGLCVGQRVVMLVQKLRFIRQRQISLGDENFGNGLAAVGAEDDSNIDPYGDRLVTNLPGANEECLIAAMEA